MITLASDCLLFELATGESIPYSADMVSVELMGDATEAVRSGVRPACHQRGLPLLQT